MGVSFETFCMLSDDNLVAMMNLATMEVLVCWSFFMVISHSWDFFMFWPLMHSMIPRGKK